MIKNYLTVDVEDYFQVSAFEDIVGKDNWDNYPPRVVENTQRILDLFDSYNVKATFFILGWVAERFPALVKEINARGHEIGCHSYYHRLVYDLTPDEFREDTRKTKDLLEQLTGRKVLGYRAPSYTITKRSLWALDILEELGFAYDSSIFPIYHDRYGLPGAPRFKYKMPDHDLTEYPISTSIIMGRKIPVAGGGYFRLFPYWFMRMALNKINVRERQPFIFYFHPWEIDPGQPRMKNCKPLSRFRHYLNLHKTTDRLHRLLEDFSFGPIKGQVDQKVVQV
ncbi:MAG: polysaccharide deacetylase [Deltaproteobacteria bacterium]|nr:MAG: polysaccharide deacetylase [Deltaproteobacteria bacterium]